MARYYVNPQPDANGDNEVHRKGCHSMPAAPEYLGEFPTCAGAVAAAKRKYPSADGCYWCSRECHTR